MADLKYNVIISTDSAIKSLEGFKKVIEGFNKTIKLDFDTQAIKSVSSTLQQITNDVKKLNSTKINFDVSKLTVPKIDTTEITQQLNRIGQARNLQIIPKISSFTFPAQKAIEVPVKPKFYSENLRPFGNAIVNGFLDVPGRISSIFSNIKLPNLRLPKFDFTGAFEGLQQITSSVGTSAGRNFGNTFTNAIGNIIQITIGNLLANAISTATNAIASQGKQLIGESVNVEQSNAQLTVLLGTQEKATKLIKELQVIARTTPYAFPELIETTKNLIAFGVPAEKAVDVTKRLGDIAFGDKTKLKNLGLLYGKIASQDFVSASNINSATKFSISIEDVASNLGISSRELTKFKSSGKLSREQIVSYEDFDEVITTLTSNMGRFNEASTKASKTLGGLLSNVPDIFGNILDDLLGVSQGVVKTGSVFNILKDEVLAFNNVFLGTDFTAYTFGLGTVFKTIVDLAKGAFTGVTTVFSELTKGITFDTVATNLKSFGDFIGNVFNAIDFVGITKSITNLFGGLDFVALGNSFVDLVKSIGDIGKAIDNTPIVILLKEITKETLTNLPTTIKDISKNLTELSKNKKDIETLVELFTTLAIGVAVFTALGVAIGLITSPFVQFIALLVIVGSVFVSIKRAGDEFVEWFGNSEWLKNAQKAWSEFWQKIGFNARLEYEKIKKLFTDPFKVEVQAGNEIKKLDGTTDYTNNLQNDTNALNQGNSGSGNLLDNITNTYNGVTTFISQKLLEIQGFWNGLNVYIALQLETVKQWFILKYDEIKLFLEGKFLEFQAFYDSLPLKAETALEQVKQWFILKFEEAKIFVQQKIQEIKTFFDELPQKATDVADSVRINFSTGFTKVVSAITSKFEGIGGTIESYFSNIKLPTLTLPPIRLPALPDIGKLLGGQSNYTGTNNFRGGITEIAERGRELVRLPSGIMSIFNDRQFTALPKGTVIYNNQDTERMLNEGYLKGSNLQAGTNNNISSSSVQNTVINRPTNIYSTNYNGYQQSSYLNPLSS